MSVRECIFKAFLDKIVEACKTPSGPLESIFRKPTDTFGMMFVRRVLLGNKRAGRYGADSAPNGSHGVPTIDSVLRRNLALAPSTYSRSFCMCM